jgi:hypothetical protein
VLHPWLEAELTAILAALPAPVGVASAAHRPAYEAWQAGLTLRFTLPTELPPLRLLLVLDNLSGHKTPAFVLWLVAHGVMPLYTPLSGSWLNRAESIQRVLVRRALAGQHPTAPEQVMQWLEDTAAGWNAAPHPLRLGWPARPPSRPEPAASPRPRWRRRLHHSSHSPTPDDLRPMAPFTPFDPLAGNHADHDGSGGKGGLGGLG